MCSILGLLATVLGKDTFVMFSIVIFAFVIVLHFHFRKFFNIVRLTVLLLSLSSYRARENNDIRHITVVYVQLK